MWKRCRALDNLHEREFAYFATRQDITLLAEKCATVYFAYAAGCSAALMCIKSPRVPLPKKKTTHKPRLCRPPGSEGSESDDREEQDIRSVPRANKTPLSWHCCLEKLEQQGWRQTALQWWKCKEPTTTAPRFSRYPRTVVVRQNESGTAALQRLGVNTCAVAPHTEPWTEQTPSVRSYWRALFMWMTGMMAGECTIEESEGLLDYSETAVPFIYQWDLSAYTLPMIEYQEASPIAQQGFFSRLFDLAVRLQRECCDMIYPEEQYALCRHFGHKTTLWLREKYQHIWCDEDWLVGHTTADALCEALWFARSESAAQSVAAEFSFVAMGRALTDLVADDWWIEMMELFSPLEDQVYEQADEPTADEVHYGDVLDLLESCSKPKYSCPAECEQQSTVFTGPSPVYLPAIWCRAEWWSLDNDTVIDPNWVRYPDSDYTVLPFLFTQLSYRLPALPLVKRNGKKKSKWLLEHVLGFRDVDNFLMRQPVRFVAAPALRRRSKNNEVYINPSFVEFSKERFLEDCFAMLDTLCENSAFI